MKGLPTQFKQKAVAVGEAAIGEVAPIIFRGVILGWLEGKTAKDFYDFTKQHVGQNWLEELVPVRVRHRIQALAKGGVEWLTGEWFLESVIGEHPDVASLIVSSAEVKTELERQLANIKAGLRQPEGA